MATFGVIVEKGSKRTFVVAVDWPGLARGAKTEELAIEAFLVYGPRYEKVVRSIGGFHAPGSTAELRVAERLPGDSGTDFGIPSLAAHADDRRIDATELSRQLGILRACRRAFDSAARSAVGITLSTGPRGGGRDLDKMVRHVVEADQAYLQQLGTKPPKWTTEPAEDYGRQIRTLQDQAFRARVAGELPPNPNAVKKLWSPRYFIRRAAWHLLDHAWELEDRSEG